MTIQRCYPIILDRGINSQPIFYKKIHYKFHGFYVIVTNDQTRVCANNTIDLGPVIPI